MPKSKASSQRTHGRHQQQNLRPVILPPPGTMQSSQQPQQPVQPPAPSKLLLDHQIKSAQTLETLQASFNEVVNRGYAPDHHTYNNYISTAGLLGHIDAVATAYQQALWFQNQAPRYNTIDLKSHTMVITAAERVLDDKSASDEKKNHALRLAVSAYFYAVSRGAHDLATHRMMGKFARGINDPVLQTIANNYINGQHHDWNWQNLVGLNQLAVQGTLTLDSICQVTQSKDRGTLIVSPAPLTQESSTSNGQGQGVATDNDFSHNAGEQPMRVPNNSFAESDADAKVAPGQTVPGAAAAAIPGHTETSGAVSRPVLTGRDTSGQQPGQNVPRRRTYTHNPYAHITKSATRKGHR